MKKVLVVEDQKWFHDALHHWFDGDLKIVSALSIKEAEKQFASNPDIDVILMDGCVPGNEFNTRALVLKFRETFNGPMIAISSIEEYQDLLVEAGCSHKSEKGVKTFKLLGEILGLK
ncbi:MAG: hypothetical protein WCW87_01485 [Candidatus Paceibacterota bacterium]